MVRGEVALGSTVLARVAGALEHAGPPRFVAWIVLDLVVVSAHEPLIPSHRYAVLGGIPRVRAASVTLSPRAMRMRRSVMPAARWSLAGHVVELLTSTRRQ